MLDSLLRNWPLKILALALAFAIWVAVTGESSIVQDFRIPLNVQLPEELIAAESPPTTVSVRLRAPETLMRRLDPLRLEVALDLQDAGPGSRNVQMRPGDVSGVPAGVEVVLIEPERFRVALDRKARKTLPVVASFSGQPARDHTVYAVRIVPEALEVEGPASLVAGLSRLRTDPIPLEGHTESFTANVSAVPASPEVRVVDPSPVQAQVILDRNPGTRTIEAVPVRLQGAPPDVFSVPSTVAVTLSGPPSLLRNLRREQIRVTADARGLEPRSDAHQIALRAEVTDLDEENQEKVSVRSLSRAKVSVSIPVRRSQR